MPLCWGKMLIFFLQLFHLSIFWECPIFAGVQGIKPHISLWPRRPELSWFLWHEKTGSISAPLLNGMLVRCSVTLSCVGSNMFDSIWHQTLTLIHQGLWPNNYINGPSVNANWLADISLFPDTMSSLQYNTGDVSFWSSPRLKKPINSVNIDFNQNNGELLKSVSEPSSPQLWHKGTTNHKHLTGKKNL